MLKEPEHFKTANLHLKHFMEALIVQIAIISK